MVHGNTTMTLFNSIEEYFLVSMDQQLPTKILQQPVNCKVNENVPFETGNNREIIAWLKYLSGESTN